VFRTATLQVLPERRAPGRLPGGAADDGGVVSTARAIPHWRQPADCRHRELSDKTKTPCDMQQSRAITRKSASNLVLGFVLLPKPKRDGMSALYAFCRSVDDIADETTVPIEQRRAALESWRSDIRRIYDKQEPEFPVNQELAPVIARYSLPFDYFGELLNGVEMDLEIDRYKDYEQLDLYCYRVASVVGLLSIEVFGYTDSHCREYAVSLGKALQLTNILRDVRTDAERGRIYLPSSELTAFRVSVEEILRLQYSDRFAALAASVAARARQFYSLARTIALPSSDRKAMVAAELMGSVYWRLLRKLERRRFDVFGPTPTRLSKGQKLALIFQAWVRFAAGIRSPAYG
jgi:phytoene synthase